METERSGVSNNRTTGPDAVPPAAASSSVPAGTSPSNLPSHEPPASSAQYGIMTGYFLVIASMVGAGILICSGYTLHDTGNPAGLLLVWILGGLVAMAGALTLAELGTRMPRVGGDYWFVREAFGAVSGCVAGWATFWVGFAAPTAIIALQAAENSLRGVSGHAEIPVTTSRIFATGLILAVGLNHCQGHRQSQWLQIASTTLKFALLLILACWGLAAGNGDWKHWQASHYPSTNEWLHLCRSFIFVGYAYSGWNAAAYMAGEIRSPRQSLPWCLVGGTATVTLLYLLINVVYVYALSPAEMQRLDVDEVGHVASLAAERLFGSQAVRYLSLAVGLTLIASVSAYLLAGPRILVAMARDGVFPAWGAYLHPRRQTPIPATLTQTVAAAVLVWTGSFVHLLEYTSAGLAVVSVFVVASIFPLRKQNFGAGPSQQTKPFLVPGYPWIPLFFVGVNVCALAYLIAYDSRRWVIFVALATLAPGGVWGLMQRNAAPAGSSKNPQSP